MRAALLFVFALAVALAVGYSAPAPAADRPGATWLGCTTTGAATAVICGGASPLCPPAAVLAACTCTPLIDGFEEISCPGFG
jgi:hypothetical protein